MRRIGLWSACIASLIALGASGCGARRAAAVRNAHMERYEQTLIRAAARDTGCNPAQLQPQQISAEPVVYSVLSCVAPVEYWLRCTRGARCDWERVPSLNLAAAQALGCPPEMIQQQPGQVPTARFAAGCGRMAPFGVVCNGVGCGWAQTGPTQGGSPGVATAPQPEYQAQVPPPPPGNPASPGGPSGFLQTHVQSQREAILSCVDSGSVVLRMRWTAQGEVVIDLPPELAGSAAEGCIQAVIGALRVSTQGAGEIVVPVR